MVFFDRLTWLEDRMLLDRLVFRLEHYRNDERWELGDQCFVFYKIKPLIDQYEKLFLQRSGFRPQRILELGMFEAGSLAFWYEIFRPAKLVGIDIQVKENSDYFNRYYSARQLQEKLKTYWGTDQTDGERLRAICAAEFDGPLDLVIDDASHMYGPTKRSFDLLFPLLRPGGLYIVEDWAWAHWAPYQQPGHPWMNEIPLTRFVFDLAEAVGSAGADPSAFHIANIALFQGFVGVEKGDRPMNPDAPFALEQLISRRP